METYEVVVLSDAQIDLDGADGLSGLGAALEELGKKRNTNDI